VADRTRYLLAYDIRDKRRLRRVHQVAKAWGYPLQYSVFVCDLSRSELLLMKRDLRDEMSTAQDSVSLFDLGPPNGRGIRCIEFIGKAREIPDGDADVW